MQRHRRIFKIGRASSEFSVPLKIAIGISLYDPEPRRGRTVPILSAENISAIAGLLHGGQTIGIGPSKRLVPLFVAHRIGLYDPQIVHSVVRSGLISDAGDGGTYRKRITGKDIAAIASQLQDQHAFYPISSVAAFPLLVACRVNFYCPEIRPAAAKQRIGLVPAYVRSRFAAKDISTIAGLLDIVQYICPAASEAAVPLLISRGINLDHPIIPTAKIVGALISIDAPDRAPSQNVSAVRGLTHSL